MPIRYKGEIKFEPWKLFPINPEDVRKVYGAGCRYLGAWGKENTEDHLHALYYQPNPPKPEFSNYFLLSNWGGEVYISNGLNFTNKSITNACVDRKGKVIVSLTVHHFVESSCKSFHLDGGPCYQRVVGDVDWVRDNRVHIVFDKDEINVIDPSNGLILTTWKEQVG